MILLRLLRRNAYVIYRDSGVTTLFIIVFHYCLFVFIKYLFYMIIILWHAFVKLQLDFLSY